ncbi:MAG TPA: undecaprenyl-diphosphatase [Lentisphaeria bacterium]|nr:MAG: undecaprenyl-diphosphatase [Lentisphaerae bacterium GWF2_50_93]HCE43947.1 undecaprenyl-diphosphatase [Lentisphaeria bacterium]
MDLIFKSIIMGIVEGITEFLPISSTGHLIIVEQFLKFDKQFADMFEIVIQLGAVLSVVVYFHRRLNPFVHEPEKRKETLELWKKTIAGVVPALIIGGILGKKISEHLFNPLVVSIALIVGGVILIAIESFRKKERIFSVTEITYGFAIAVGFIQCLAMVPGTSRSAATIIGAMLLGATRGTAAEFSFFLAIPTMVAASAYSLMKHASHMSLIEGEALAVGFVVSFLVAWAVIAVFMNYIRKNDFKPFGYYRIILGILVLIFCLK